MRFNIYLAALAATTAFASPAFAQTATASATAEAHGLILQRLTLTSKDDLDFGTIIASNALGTVSIDADTGGRSVSGGVTPVPTNVGNRALFVGAGAVAQSVLLTLTAPTVLVSTTNSADTIVVDSMLLDNGDLKTRTIDTTATF